ncbi:hypothetical protein O181_046171 [Austropuccinia psidii MF-1]|uniref:MTHFR SAM-binding regulatory domain-containing protein n=1 Tax=Austropuccinia psidii MF-1 TaxID=1389203 RepID=A0A9Q3HID9_9BASI|nr:hypothetical protein [Austropuccinia psidii MF-1]
MKKIVDLISSLKDDEVYYTFEFFPPHTSDGLANLYNRIGRMIKLKPSCLHITWGAGGSTSQASLQLSSNLQEQLSVPVCLHLTCTNIERSRLDDVLAHAKQAGIRNILALRGDPPRGNEYWAPSDHEFVHAIDLVKYIRKHYGYTFCIGVAGYPEGAIETNQNQELSYLKEKVDAGADFVVSQLFYDVDNFLLWAQACRQSGINVPIIPGIMPIQSYAGFCRLNALCKTKIPESTHASLLPIKGDDEAVREFGIELSTQMIQRLQQNGFRAFHLCTLNLEKTISRLVQQLGWSDFPPVSSQTIAAPSIKIATTQLVQDGLASGWDEFPNGRFGDQRSPAFGLREGYGTGSMSAFSHLTNNVHELWGSPASLADITKIFYSFAEGKLPSTPWSEEPLALETSSITPFLLHLNKNGWWTAGSQPAIDGADSLDPVVGFGPEGGSVYQKAFVEFFIPEDELKVLLKAIEMENKKDSEGVSQLRYYAGNCHGEQITTNMADGETNAVTWGVFRGAEVVTTTLIEAQSFTTWKQQAFEIWQDWADSYAPHTITRKFLTELKSSYWLCTIVDHNYKEPEKLWTFVDSVLKSLRSENYIG